MGDGRHGTRRQLYGTNVRTEFTITAVESSVLIVPAFPNGIPPGSTDLPAYKWSIYNNSSFDLYLRFGALDANITTDWNIKLVQDDYLERPHDWFGSVQGIWSGVNSIAQVVVMTAVPGVGDG